MGRFSTFGFLNPFVQSRWKERAKKFEEDQKKRVAKAKAEKKKKQSRA